MRTVAILPVKHFTQAKQRLGAGLTPEDRRHLAEAMFRDVLTALSGSDTVDGVIVVTAGTTIREIASEHRAGVVEDDQHGHNAAAQLGIDAAMRAGADRALVVPGDCPALDPAELDGLLRRPVTPPSALIIPDRHGTGTNALLLTPPDALAPSFGPGSRDRHTRHARAAGIHTEVVEVASLAMDVDTPEDLETLRAALESDSGLARVTVHPGRAEITRALLRHLTVFPKC